MIELLTFIKERRFFLYKDGTWYSNYKRDWGSKQKFYKDEELIELFKQSQNEKLFKNIKKY